MDTGRGQGGEAEKQPGIDFGCVGTAMHQEMMAQERQTENEDATSSRGEQTEIRENKVVVVVVEEAVETKWRSCTNSELELGPPDKVGLEDNNQLL